MPRDMPGAVPISHQRIVQYLEALGLVGVDPAAEGISCWDSLQAFVAMRIAVRPLTRPMGNARLKTYGLEQGHPVRMFVRHVLS